jgi:acetyltransferase
MCNASPPKTHRLELGRNHVDDHVVEPTSGTSRARQLLLQDGAEVVVRPIREQDAGAFAHAYTRLSEQSRWLRFLSAAKCLSACALRDLTSVDHHQHVALAAIAPTTGEIIGTARYIRLPGRPGEAEMAIEVIDDWQRRGVGRGLLAALSEHARAHGIERFVAIVAEENLPMQRAVRHATLRVDAAGDELEYLLQVDSLRPQPHAPAARTTPSRPAAARIHPSAQASTTLAA